VKDPPAFRTVVIAVDGSKLAERALPYVRSLARGDGLKVVLVTVVPSIEMLVAQTADAYTATPSVAVDAGAILESSRRESRAYLDGAAGQLKAGGITVRTVVAEGPAAERIVAVARDAGADLIALTTHGRGGLERVVFGSVADAVVRSAPCPVLVVPAREPTKSAKA
jgi:nucleotide-binding universal stress UspA family protein